MSSVVIALCAGGAAHAGNTRATPPVNVVAPAPSSALYPDDLPGPQAEVVRDPAKLALPAVPAFELPATTPGLHGPRELRVRGRALYGRELAVRGYVTWIYDCAAELARSNREATAAEIADLVDSTPGLCETPMFSLGDTRQTPRDGSIWVVDVPRPPERSARAPAAPRLAVGDYVTVTGRWAIESPGGERNSNGLLVYRTLDRPTPSATPAALIPAPSGLPEIAVVTDVPLRTIVDTGVRNASVGQLNACNRALAAKQYDAALGACRAATDAWPDNHLAWYAEASAHLATGKWREAGDAIAHAVALRPDQGMYQLYDGMARYEAARVAARADDAAALTSAPLEAARDALLRASKLAPALWRAHYYLGRVYRDLDDGRRAAEQLTQAIALHPGHRAAYLALCELYRRWGYLDQAIAVATLGTANVTGDPGDLWFELALALDGKHADAAALAAFDKLLGGRPDDAGALLLRGQLHLRKGDTTSAKRDLERVAADPRSAVAARLATQLLARIASRARARPTSSRGAHGYKKFFLPSEQLYEPWTAEDAKYRF